MHWRFFRNAVDACLPALSRDADAGPSGDDLKGGPLLWKLSALLAGTADA